MQMGGCDSAVTTRVRSAWKKFREYLPILTGKGFSLKLKGKVYATCVRSCLMHGSEIWPMKVEHKLKMNRTEMSMIRWMCGVKLNERKNSEELRELLGLEPVSLMIKKSSRGVRRSSFREGLEDIASAVARTYNGGLGAEPPAGSRGEPLVGVRGRSPLKLKAFYCETSKGSSKFGPFLGKI